MQTVGKILQISSEKPTKHFKKLTKYLRRTYEKLRKSKIGLEHNVTQPYSCTYHVKRH